MQCTFGVCVVMRKFIEQKCCYYGRRKIGTRFGVHQKVENLGGERCSEIDREGLRMYRNICVYFILVLFYVQMFDSF